ncbi:MAG: hydroxymyristoyl-ACP dehydratase [Betaproteobacteria bacterium]
MSGSQPATLDRAGIAARIPHSGTMCLLDRVLQWNDGGIRCSASSHRDSANPLRARGTLSSACGIEYAAQAMAVHGALCAGTDGESAPRRGLLTSVRAVVLAVSRLDDVEGELTVEAELLSGDGRTVLYAFSVGAGGSALVSGRAAVILDAEAFGTGA